MTENKKERSGGMSKNYPPLCICPKCGYQIAHVQGVPCRTELCPVCSVKMVRKNSLHDTGNGSTTQKQ